MSHSLDNSLDLAIGDNDTGSLARQFHSTRYNNRSPISMPAQPSTQPPLDFHQFESVHLQSNHIKDTISDKSRPKQKMVAPKKKASAKKKDGHGARGGRNSATSRATEPPAPTGLKLTFKLGLKAKGEGTHDDNVRPSLPGVALPPGPPQDELCGAEDESVDGEPLPSTGPVAMSRSGRQIKKPRKDAEYMMGSEMDQFVDQSSISKLDDDDGDYGPALKSSPPHNGKNNLRVLELESEPKSGRPHRAKNTHSSLPTVDEELSSDTIAPLTPRLDRYGKDLMSNIPDEISDILDSLRGRTTVLIELPSLSHKSNPDQDVPYSAKTLVQLYLVCYQSRLWDLCDLIADTWIRAFHSLRRLGQQKPDLQTWRPNRPLEKRQEEAEMDAEALRKAREERHSRKKTRVKAVGFEENAPDYKLDVTDPELENNITSFDSSLLFELYENTDEKCGARFLWADAMALGGSKMEDLLAKTLRVGHSWHPQLFVNIMFTSLRMVRRKLTLKIEEGCEGAWCKRYHEHSKHGLPCYRELAWREKELRLASEHAARTMNKSAEADNFKIGTSNENEQDMAHEGEEEIDVEMEQADLAAQIMEELGRGEKRGLRDVGEVEMSAPKKRQVHWGAGVDIDAEGESEEN